MGADSSGWAVYQSIYNASGAKNTNQQNANTTALADGGGITIWESL
jgi:hypothetical protein